MQQLPVRHPRFDLAEGTNPMWTPAVPEFACAANAVSLLMPYMEPYFVRAVSRVVDDLPASVAADARSYVGQEAEHHRQHRNYNRLLRHRYRALRPVEAVARRVYGWLGRTRSRGFNVAFTAASETIAYSAARWAAQHHRSLFADADPELSALFIWHLAEEVEHKSVAWDVHQAIGGGRRRYLGAAIVAVALVAALVIAGTAVMAASERRLLSPIAWGRLAWWGVGFTFELLPNLAVSLTAGHHPRAFVDPAWYEFWLRQHPAP
ncbi:MAG: metal-dependent hydrolase [Actinomycetota bacterium]